MLEPEVLIDLDLADRGLAERDVEQDAVSSRAGIPIAIGLMPRILSIDPHGAMTGSVWLIAMPT